MKFNNKDFRRGNLVRNKDDEYGIISDSQQKKIVVYMGNGLNTVENPDDWETVRFGISDIPNCFIRILPVMPYAAPDDINVKIEEILGGLDKYAMNIGENAWAIQKLAEQVNEIEKIPKDVMNRIMGRGEIDLRW